MRFDRRHPVLGAAASAATALAFISTTQVVADTGPAPVGAAPDPAGILDLGGIVQAGLVLAVGAGLGFVAIRRPGWRRRLAAAIVAIGSILVGGIFALAAFFSDFSGEHRTYPILALIGLAVVIVGLGIATALWLSDRHAKPDRPPDR